MGDVLVESPLPAHRKTGPTTIPSIENFEGLSTEGGDEYSQLKKLQRQLEYIQLQEEYIKDEQRLVFRTRRG
jgi:26S proteasome regulatory subunit T3